MTWRTPAYLAWVDSGATVAELGARVCVTEADARRAIMGTGWFIELGGGWLARYEPNEQPGERP